MKKTLLAVLLCMAVLTAGCGAGTAAPSDGKKDNASEQVLSASTVLEAEETEEVQETEKAQEEAPAPDQEETQNVEPEDLSADSAGAGTGAEAEAVTAEQPESGGEAAGEESDAAADADAGTSDAGEEAESAGQEEAAPEAEAARSSQAPGEAEEAEPEAAAPEQKPDQGAQENGAAEAEAVKDDDADEYIPEGFWPYGVYELVYDSGYVVKSRYSEAGLTFYMESEEFLFILDKNLPNFPAKISHILFNTTAPMDPAEAEAAGEKFPYDEGYVMNISLDDGSYYQVWKSQLDLKGRIFVRDLYESFRQKWEGAF